MNPENPLPFPGNSVDLISACQAVHWFDIPGFYREADRVLAPGGVIAVIGYHLTGVSPRVQAWRELNELRDEVYRATRPYFDNKRGMVDDGYSTIPDLVYQDRER